MVSRVLNGTAAAVGLILSGPLVLLLALLIRLETPGSGVFAQRRVGRNGQEFTCYKLRTMFVGTPDAATHLADGAAVTRIGSFLRKTKLDELPQLWNVLVGDMNIVGPRPCLPNQTELIAARNRRGVLSMRPGITGLAQIQGIDMSDPEKLASVDEGYLKTRSLWMDARIIWLTVFGSGSGDRIVK